MNQPIDYKAMAERAADVLQGTALSLENLPFQLGKEYVNAIDSAEFCDRLDELVFCCDTCGWWHEISDMRTGMSGGDICDDCKADERAECDDYDV